MRSLKYIAIAILLTLTIVIGLILLSRYLAPEESFTPVSNLSWRLHSVYFTSVNCGWAVGYGEDPVSHECRGVILHYNGTSWIEVKLPRVNSIDWRLRDICFPSANEGWAVGIDFAEGEAVILHYKNGKWVKVSPPTPSKGIELYSVSFPTVSEGWAVGYNRYSTDGVIFHYSNGKWTAVSTPKVSRTHWALYSVHFPTSSEGWAVGRDYVSKKGIILHYVNGEWHTVSTPTVNALDWHLSSLHFSTSNEGWVVGVAWKKAENATECARGLILHYKNGTWMEVSFKSEESGFIYSSTWRCSVAFALVETLYYELKPKNCR